MQQRDTKQQIAIKKQTIDSLLDEVLLERY